MPSSNRLLLFVGPMIILLLILILCISLGKRSGVESAAMTQSMASNQQLLINLKQKSKASKAFARQKDFNTRICFLVDMKLPSGQNRFFVYNMEKDSLLNSNLVAHGRCNQNWLEGRKYANTIGCGCTSLGRYKIGQPYHGKFGLAYKLYGLDSSNSNAYNRFVVLHSYWAMPEKETGEEICQSDGCPMVSKKFMEELRPMIDESKKPILLWIFN